MMNFNDFPASLITLFHIMVVNNWYVTANMYYYVMDSSWPIFYFMLFWVMTVLIMLNLVIAFVLDIYTEVSQNIQVEYKRRANVQK